MTLLLVRDMIRRLRGWTAGVGLLLGAVLWWVVAASGSPTHGIGISMGLALIAGPLLVFDRSDLPLVPYLPVSRREVWRSLWIMSAVFPVVLTVAIKLPATVLGSGLGWSSLTLSAVIDFAYAGAGCALGAVGLSRRRAGTATGAFGALLAMIATLIVVFAMRDSLPVRWGDITIVHLALLTLALILTWGSYFYVPPPASRMPRRAVTSPTWGPAHRDTLAGLSGLRLLLARELAAAAALALALVVTFATIGLLMDGTLSQWRTSHELLRRLALLIFDSSAARQPFDPLSQSAWYGFSAIAMSSRFPAMIRHLRVLPIGSPRLHTLLLGWPALIWSTVWLLLLVLHFAVGAGPIVSLRSPLWLALVGVSALSQSAMLHSHSWFKYSVPQGVLIPALVIPALRFAGEVPAWVLLVTGSAGLAGALMVNRSALARGGTYRAMPRLRTENI